MKWVKQRYNAKANTHRAGWKYWDLMLDDGGEGEHSPVFIRFTPSGKDAAHGVYTVFSNNVPYDPLDYKHFPTLKEAKQAVVAFLVAMKLEE